MTLKQLRLLAISEGISWITLLFIAMPLKYIWASPLAVKYIGMLHGILFIGLALLLSAMVEKKLLTSKTGIRVFIASFIPFGTFFTDRALRAQPTA